MTEITILLSDERLDRLRKLATQAGVSSEEFARRSLESMLDRAEEEFGEAAEYVLRKNAELYRRLA